MIVAFIGTNYRAGIGVGHHDVIVFVTITPDSDPVPVVTPAGRVNIEIAATQGVAGQAKRESEYGGATTEPPKMWYGFSHLDVPPNLGILKFLQSPGRNFTCQHKSVSKRYCLLSLLSATAFTGI